MSESPNLDTFRPFNVKTDAVNLDPTAPTQEPLFDWIDNLETIESGVIEDGLLASSSETLRAFDAPEPFIAEVKALAAQLEPMLGLGLNRAPTDRERATFEGRGAYHVIPRLNEKTGEMVIYVKGTGSPSATRLGQESRDYPGYPNATEDMLHDTTILQPGDTARVKGALHAAGACLEQINAAAILGVLAKKHNWQAVQDAIDAGASIPLGAKYLPGLSGHVSGLIEQYVENGPNLAARESLQIAQNKYAATTALLVPSDRRIAGGVRRTEVDVVLPPRVSDSYLTGATMRKLALETGSCFSRSSGHQQNLYAVEESERANYAQADNYDLVTLGAHGDRAMSTKLQERYGASAVIPKSTVRQALLFNPLDRGSIIPNYVPRQGRDTSEQALRENVLEPQLAFWNGLLEGLADPEAIARIPDLAPYMLKEFEMAAAILLHEAGDHETWETVAAQKQALVESMPSQYGVQEAYQADQADAISDELVAAFDRALRDTDLSIANVVDFLKSGDEYHLLSRPYIAGKLELQEAVDDVENVHHRVELLTMLGNYGMQYNFQLESHPETLDNEFTGQFTERILGWLYDDEVEQALVAAEVVAIAANPSLREELALGGAGELAGHHYTRLALGSRGLDELRELRERVTFEGHLQALCHEIAVIPYRPGRPDASASPEEIRAEALASIQSGILNIHDYTTAFNLPPANVIVKWIVSGAMESRLAQFEITAWLQGYGEQRDKASAARSPMMRSLRSAGVNDYVDKNAEITTILPELRLAHDVWMVNQLEQKHPDIARHFVLEAMNYYEERLPGRTHIGTADPYTMTASSARPTWVRFAYGDGLASTESPNGHLDGLIARYEAIGLPAIADRYKAMKRQ
jgi:hypothetical protein